VVVPVLSGTEGFPINGQIATFASTDIQGSSSTATIAWGDGHITAGTVVMDGSNFDVDGSNTYAVPGTYPVTVKVNGSNGSTVSGRGMVTIAATMPLVTGTTITPTAGQPFTSAVSSFTDPYPGLTAASYGATIVWGDGHTSIGMILPNGSAFDVSGTNTYTAAGSRMVTVTVVRLIDNQMATATTNAVVLTPSLSASGTTITAVAGQLFNGAVASFTDANPQPAPSGYSASISWGDGQSSVGTVAATGPEAFSVSSTHGYAAPSSNLPVLVTITRIADGQTVTANSTAVVVTAPSSLTGKLSPISDTGVLNTDGITAINQPEFTGTAIPYAIVQLYGRRSDQAQPVLLGQAIANAQSMWSLSVGALPDGVYSFSVVEIPPTGLPTQMFPVSPGSVTIDTVPPAVVSATAPQNSGLVFVVFKDVLTGLDLTSLTNPAKYALLGPHGSRFHPSSVTIVSNATVRPGDPVTVALQFSFARRSHAGQTIALGGIADLAANRLPREYIKVAPASDGPIAAGRVGRVHLRIRHGQHRA
jgi:hypothetical protein